MIPQHLVYRAAQAIWETGTTSEWRNDVWAAPHLTRARAALEAVAADFWEEGAAHAEGRGGYYDPEDNPYKASEGQ